MKMIWLVPAILGGAYAVSKSKWFRDVFSSPQAKAESADFHESLFNMLISAVRTTPMGSTIEMTAKQKADILVREEEGYKNVVYTDSLGKLTGGIGHLITLSDKAFGYNKAGVPIPTATIEKWYAQDFAKAFEAAKKQAREANKYTPDFIAALTSVNFQLGTGWIYEFVNTWAAIKAGRIPTAIGNLRQSAWNRQTPNRVAYFIQTLQSEFA